jgi:pyruvate dehydrogenase E2 component (dihydrolipoamide acetyltransferase)
MAIEVVMPQLGLSMDSGRIVEWLKKPGDRVAAGDLLLTVESDKSTVDVEAVENGILHPVLGPEAGAIPVGEVIAYLLAEGERPPAGDAVPLGTASPTAAVPAGETLPATAGGPQAGQLPTPLPTQDGLGGTGGGSWLRPNRSPSSPAARRRAAELGLDWRQAGGTGPAGRIKERDVLVLADHTPGPAAEPPAKLTPVAERMARSAGLDLTDLARRFPGRRLGREEVETAIREAVSQSRQIAQPAAGQAPERREPMGRLRSLIAGRMVFSSRTTAPVTLTTEADASELVRLRAVLKDDPQTEVVPSYNALLAKLVAGALVEHPALNASIDGDEIIYWPAVNIGTAVDTERGLVVPVIRDVQSKSVQAISREMAEMLPRAKAGKALPDELTGGTFTITNLGPYEVDAFTPIINSPECAVLGVGRLVDKYVVVQSQPAVRTMMALSLTFDHRLVDGGPAARFLQRVKQFVELPYLWLVERC